MDWNALAPDLTRANGAQIAATSRFIYQVGASLHAQYGGGEGTSATGKQIENAFRLQWGYSAVPRRQMSVISKDAFGYDDEAWGPTTGSCVAAEVALSKGASVGAASVQARRKRSAKRPERATNDDIETA